MSGSGCETCPAIATQQSTKPVVVRRSNPAKAGWLWVLQAATLQTCSMDHGRHQTCWVILALPSVNVFQRAKWQWSCLSRSSLSKHTEWEKLDGSWKYHCSKTHEVITLKCCLLRYQMTCTCHFWKHPKVGISDFTELSFAYSCSKRQNKY